MKLTDKEILYKAIDKAMDNGLWDGRNKATILIKDSWNEFISKVSFMGDGGSIDLDYQAIIFSHDFARAFWGEKHSGHQDLVRKRIGNYITYPINDWQHHLQRMVIEENPIKYLSLHI
jgi:hypothetical protein